MEVSAVDAVYEDQPEQQRTEMTESTELDEPLQRRPKHVQRIIAGVKQNFGKINVAPEFSEEDLVPVEMPDLLDSCGSEEDEEEASEEEDREENGNAEEECGEAKEGKDLHVAGHSDRAGTKSTREVNKELDEKIAKLKHFLDRAKSKRFSAIRIPKGLSEKVFVSGETKTEQKNMKPQPKAAVHSRKRKAVDIEASVQQNKLTSKEKRRIDRTQKIKKVGVRYYDTHNVKNKNTNRKVPTESNKVKRAKR